MPENARTTKQDNMSIKEKGKRQMFKVQSFNLTQRTANFI